MKNIGFAALAALLGAIALQSISLIIQSITWICFLGDLSKDAPDISASGLGKWIILIPVAGALVGMLLVKFGKKVFTPLSAIIMNGTGFPFSAEGAMVSGLFILGERPLLKAAALAAGLAVMMNAPLSAAILVFELGFIEYALINVVTMLMAAAIGFLLHLAVQGWGCTFYLESIPPIRLAHLPVYLITGIVVSLFGILLTWLIKLMEKITFQRIWLPLLAAVIIGYLGWQWPEGLGTGYNFIPQLATGDVNLQIIIGLALVRYVMVILAAGTGAPGRELMISPLILIGGAMGMASVLLCSLLFNVSDLTPGLAAIIGIAALLTGRLPIVFAALVLSIEMTHQLMVVLPVLIALLPTILLRKMLVRNGIN